MLIPVETSPQFSRDALLRALIEQGSGLVYFIPSPLLLAAACPLNGDRYKESYYQICQHLLESQLVGVDGINHESLTSHSIEYFARHKYANFTRTATTPHIFYQCDALFTSSSRMNRSRLSHVSDDGQPIQKLVYFVTVLNQRSLFSRYERFDQYLLRHLLRLHSAQVEKAFGQKIHLNHYIRGRVIEQEQLSDLAFRLLLRYTLPHDHDSVDIDVNYYFVDSYVDQFADTYVSLFHTPTTMAIQHGNLPLFELLLSNLSLNKATNWGTAAAHELETSVDQLFTRRGKVTFDMFTKFCAAVANMQPDESIVQQRIFVHALAACVKYNAKVELELLINDYAKIYYDSCKKYPMDIRHNILAYCVVSRRSLVHARVGRVEVGVSSLGS